MTNQTIEQAVEEAKEILRKVSIGEMYIPDAEARLTKALQAQRDAGAREERKQLIRELSDEYHLHMKGGAVQDFIREWQEALTPPTK